ncbi:adenylate kinase 7-like [Synchiropus picturatus]
MQELIFINDVDQYSSKHIAQFLATFVSGDASDSLDRAREDPAFRLVGSVSSSVRADDASLLVEQLKSPSRERLLRRLLKCDIIVYNVSEHATQEKLEEATWAITTLHSEMENFENQKLFILISTVMTWAQTKSQNPGETEYRLTEMEYKRRRPHPNFKNHHVLEKLVLKLGGGKSSKLRAYVLAAGLQYGRGESLFHYFFKMAWTMDHPHVPFFGQGGNYVPMIHVYDLAGAIQNTVEVRPSSKYILALDDSKYTLDDIVVAISDAMGSGKIHKMPEEDAAAMGAQPEDLEYLAVNLRLQAFVIKDSYSLSWVSESGMVENMEAIVDEFKHARGLLPIRIFITGPPACGKSTLAKKLCHYYKVHHITMREVIEERIARLREVASEAESEYASATEVGAAQKLLDDIDECMKADGVLNDRLAALMLQDQLNSKPCTNQGFVLDGFPKTYEQAKLIFSEIDEDAEQQDEDNESNVPTYNVNTPEHIIALSAPDELLIRRVQELPQAVVEERGYTEERFLARLDRYRKRADVVESVLDYFDELEIHPEYYDVGTDVEFKEIMEHITELIGPPKNYGLSAEEQLEKERQLAEELRLKRIQEEAERKRNKEESLSRTAADFLQWQTNLAEVSKQEQERLRTQAVPLRNYLMRFVMPSLSEALVECSRIKPDDPVDFVAEHLLRKNLPT